MAGEQEILHGWYSLKACVQQGGYTYETPGGGTVFFTSVSPNADEPGTAFGDEVYRGVVTTLVSTHLPPLNSILDRMK